MKCNFLKFCDSVSPEAFRCSMKIYTHRDFWAGGREATMILKGGMNRIRYNFSAFRKNKFRSLES